MWFELAPGERLEDLRYMDEEAVASMEPEVMRTLEQSGFFAALEEAMNPEDPAVEREPCHGDFRISQRILAAKGFQLRGQTDRMTDAFHVLMSKGAYCDCEVLLNVYEGSRWRASLNEEVNRRLHERMERRRE